MKHSLIIFDCDGVLVDSEIISNRILAEQLRELEVSVSDEEVLQLFRGGSLNDARLYIEKSTGHPAPDDFEQVYRSRTFEAFKNELKPIPGVIEVLEKINHPRCVASNGPRNKIELNLKLAKLDRFFADNLFSAYDVNRWKPDPTLFLHAAKTMGHQPEDCLVIEDSAHGVMAAKRAGMSVLGFVQKGLEDELSAFGVPVFHEMHELIDLLC